MNMTAIAQVAQNGRGLRNAQEWFTRNDPTTPKQVLLVLCLLGVFVLIVWGVARVQARWRGPAKARPMRLFFRMQRRLRLGLLDCWRLFRLAGASSMSHPTALLVSPKLFDEAVSKHCAKAGAGRRRLSQHYAVIRSRLFPT